MFITKESLVANFKKVFLVSNESLALRLYNIFSEGVNMKRIYLPKFIVTLSPLFIGNIIDRNYFIFRLLDGDNDQLIQSKDISDIMLNLIQCPITEDGIRLCTCTLYEEMQIFYKTFV